MNWGWFYRDPPLPPAGRGRLGTRLARGLLWAALAIFVMSVLIFAAFQCAPSPEIRF